MEILPKVVVHNSVSVDGSLTNFEVNMPLHYEIAGRFNSDMHLVGSNTAKIGIDLFLNEIPKETKEDFKKPKGNGVLWAIPDSTGKMKGLLHVLRQSEYCQDIVVLISEKTSTDYIDYLKERNYDYYAVGIDKCDLRTSLELLRKKYDAKTILSDTGSILSNLLIKQRLVSEISLLIHPQVVGKNGYNMFAHIDEEQKLELMKTEKFENGYVWILYRF